MKHYKRIVKIALIVLAILAMMVSAYFAFGGTEYHVDQITDMQVTCERSYQVINGPLEEACGKKIDALQQQGYEVTVKDGLFRAEKQ